jgi:hypothetical protein
MPNAGLKFISRNIFFIFKLLSEIYSFKKNNNKKGWALNLKKNYITFELILINIFIKYLTIF